MAITIFVFITIVYYTYVYYDWLIVSITMIFHWYSVLLCNIKGRPAPDQVLVWRCDQRRMPSCDSDGEARRDTGARLGPGGLQFFGPIFGMNLAHIHRHKHILYTYGVSWCVCLLMCIYTNAIANGLIGTNWQQLHAIAKEMENIAEPNEIQELAMFTTNSHIQIELLKIQTELIFSRLALCRSAWPSGHFVRAFACCFFQYSRTHAKVMAIISWCRLVEPVLHDDALVVSATL